MQSLVALLLLLAQGRATEAAANDLVRHVPLAVRCDLVGTMFSDEAFESLGKFLASHCTQVAWMGGRARVEVTIDTGLDDGGFTPIETLFPETRLCEGRGYVVHPTEDYWASNPYMIWVAMNSVARRSYDFNVTVSVPNGVHDCGGVNGRAVLKHGKWTISELKPAPP